ncbi:MAG: hypothetical protein ABSC47_01400 [Terracidiphilus sp.]|jgi:uncharacterized protein involved in cysteine biosynthesis
MLLNKLQESPAKAVSVGMICVTAGLMMIIIGACWPRIPFLAHIWPDWNDFLRGFVFGIAIALEITGVVINATAAANKRKAL